MDNSEKRRKDAARVIALNNKDGRKRPCYTIKCRGKTRYARGFTATGVMGMEYGAPLSCGARVYLVCDDVGLTLYDEMSFQEAKNA